MQGKRWLVAGFVVLAMGAAVAQEEPMQMPKEEAMKAEMAKLVVDRAVIALDVEEREPVGESVFFRPDVGQILCWSKIVGASDETVIYHVWRHGPTERAKVELPVRSSAWRTWSTKKILPSWTGDWEVEVQDADGNVLETLSFTIGETSGSAG